MLLGVTISRHVFPGKWSWMAGWHFTLNLVRIFDGYENLCCVRRRMWELELNFYINWLCWVWELNIRSIKSKNSGWFMFLLSLNLLGLSLNVFIVELRWIFKLRRLIQTRHENAIAKKCYKITYTQSSSSNEAKNIIIRFHISSSNLHVHSLVFWSILFDRH